MRNIKLIIEYDGTNYAGWQLQPNGVTIQQVLEEALATLLHEPVRLHGSGRTDAGVHARGMVACFTTEKTIPLRAFSDGLNTLLPQDVVVRQATEVTTDFHPRYAATGKLYRYTIHAGGRRSPLSRLYSWHLRGELDLDVMRRAAACLVGEHDFAALRGAGCAARTTVRRVDGVVIEKHGELVTIDVRGSGFLRHMVRNMVGTLVEVGQGRRAADSIPDLLAAGERSKAGITAPACGLCLVEVYY
ncbi:tRNA pseudouridine(38-40) synthase TruA [Geobacter sp. AOG1]|uniref:tRNA pseudouridine(38-40) synthase TruA n=1 Tax=Geobacter sp. AOG1 TaxID=1566346 RepID=UPI001CC74B77|nr:tRNA pseudouridine(38-40) synthase TruA [Geobacter sp. AOG1]GFE59250.1 tRNA pseudouridine synthase A [Geobacter sp. AOG1]